MTTAHPEGLGCSSPRAWHRTSLRARPSIPDLRRPSSKALAQGRCRPSAKLCPRAGDPCCDPRTVRRMRPSLPAARCHAPRALHLAPLQARPQSAATGKPPAAACPTRQAPSTPLPRARTLKHMRTRIHLPAESPARPPARLQAAHTLWAMRVGRQHVGRHPGAFHGGEVSESSHAAIWTRMPKFRGACRSPPPKMGLGRWTTHPLQPEKAPPPIGVLQLPPGRSPGHTQTF